MKKTLFFKIFIFIIHPISFLFCQEITTANVFFSEISEMYSKIKTYSANISITAGATNQSMYATTYFKYPNRLRIDFTKPNNQVILFTGDTLTIYVPEYRMILNQTIDKDNTLGTTYSATPQGLSLLKRSYTIAYETSAAPQPLEEGSKEQVIILILNRRSATEAFRRIRLFISPQTKLIRRIEALPISGSKIIFDFTSYQLDVSIPDARFLYDIPPNADMINNFLFE